MNRLVPLLLLSSLAYAGDWTGWGAPGTRNMVATEKRAPASFEPGVLKDGEIDLSTTTGVKWVVPLGSQTYGNPTVADGRVFVGTNNAGERRPGITGDYSLVQAFSEDDGSLLWQLSVPKLGSGKVNDWEFLGICSSPTVVGDVVYVVTNRGEVVALDVHGLSNGNQGFDQEGQYMAGPGKPPMELSELDADILWRFDMPTDLGVFPHNVTSSSVLVAGDTLFVTTSNGTDWSHLDLPSPFSPSLIALDRTTGELLAEEISGISERTLHANWSSPALAPASASAPEQVVFGAGDGFVYGFDVKPGDDDGLPILTERWRADANNPEYREKNGQPVRYATFEGPSEIIGTPVVANGHAYVAIGQDPEHGPGVGRLSAVRLDGSGDITSSHVSWTYDGIHRSISTVSATDRYVFAADYDGVVHALDAKSGELLWTHNTGGHIWGSTFLVGKQLYIGNEDGILTVLKAGKKPKVLAEIALSAPIYSTPIVANGVLYVATQTHLYAIGGK